MPQSRDNLERQLKLAEQQLSQAAAVLTEQGVPEKELRRQAKWRECNAVIRQLKSRLRAVTAKEKLRVEVAQRRAEKAAASAE